MTDRLKEIEAARAKLAELEANHAADLRKELASLPAKYGFESARAFIRAVKRASGTSGKRAGRAKGTRAVITDDIRAEVKKLAEAGVTGAGIAKKVGISLPSVQNIKKAFGLVKKRKK